MAEQRPKYGFVMSHQRDAKFEHLTRHGQMHVRDMGVAEATGGAIRVAVARAAGPCVPGDAGGRHHHDMDIQLMYCLKGWQLLDLGDGVGQVRVEAGTFWTQPRGMVHEVLDHSPDFEVLVVNLPAAYATYPAGA
jgi:quercetin dioxygenase-like cupin family protein